MADQGETFAPAIARVADRSKHSRQVSAPVNLGMTLPAADGADGFLREPLSTPGAAPGRGLQDPKVDPARPADQRRAVAGIIGQTDVCASARNVSSSGAVIASAKKPAVRARLPPSAFCERNRGSGTCFLERKIGNIAPRPLPSGADWRCLPVSKPFGYGSAACTSCPAVNDGCDNCLRSAATPQTSAGMGSTEKTPPSGPCCAASNSSLWG